MRKTKLTILVTLLCASCVTTSSGFGVVMPDDAGKTITVANGTIVRIVVDDGYDWTLSASDTTLLEPAASGPITGQGFTAFAMNVKTVKAGQMQVRTTGDPHCRTTVPACATPSKTYEFTLIVR
jgi:hypothetical protein